MHVLLIHQAFASPEQPGGTRHYELASHLVEQGHACTIIASDRSYLTGERFVDSTNAASAPGARRVLIRRVYTYPSLHRSFVWRVVSFLSFMLTSLWAALRTEPIDLVVGTSPPIFQAVSAWLVAAVRRRPFLLEIRDLWPEFAIGLGVLKNPLLIALSAWLEAFLYAQATHILVNSPAYVTYLVNKGIPAAKVSLIANGVDPSMFDPQADGQAMRQELALGDKFVVTYAGALGLANDIETIIRTAARLREEPAIHFLLVGDGKERIPLEQQARDLALTNVTFAGSRPKTCIPDVLAASDACVATLRDIPMFRTTYPNKIFDYMAAGRPTVLAIDGVIREVVEAARGGLYVPPGDDAALAAAVQRLAQDRQQSQAMGTAARTYVVEHFNRHRQAEQFLELVQRLAARGSTR